MFDFFLFLEIKEIEVLEKTVQTLGVELYPSEYAFPVDFLVEELENINNDLHEVSDPQFIWVVKLMSNIGVSFDTLFAVYDSLIAKKSDLDDKLCAVIPVTALIENWLQHSTYQVSYDFARQVVERLQFYTSQLSMKSNDDAFKSVLGRLRYLIQQVNNSYGARGI